MRDLLLRWLVTALALFAAISFVPGLHFDGGTLRLLLVAVVFGIVNALLKPILSLLTCPLILLTFGLFVLVVNGVLLMITAWLSTRWGLGFSIDGFWPAFWGGLVVSLASALLMALTRRTPKPRGDGWHEIDPRG